jgi:hypothetical protein
LLANCQAIIRRAILDKDYLLDFGLGESRVYRLSNKGSRVINWDNDTNSERRIHESDGFINQNDNYKIGGIIRVIYS